MENKLYTYGVLYSVLVYMALPETCIFCVLCAYVRTYTQLYVYVAGSTCMLPTLHVNYSREDLISLPPSLTTPSLPLSLPPPSLSPYPLPPSLPTPSLPLSLPPLSLPPPSLLPTPSLPLSFSPADCWSTWTLASHLTCCPHHWKACPFLPLPLPQQ